MIDQKMLNAQLKKLKLRFRIFGRSELKELKKILRPDENIKECVYGYYQGGSGLLVATNERLLLVDKRTFYLNLEDIRFESIRSVDITLSYLQASLFLQTHTKTLTFRTVSDARLSNLKRFITRKLELVEHVKPMEQAYASVEERAKPYLNPAWRPHHATILKRRKPVKFYPIHQNQNIIN